MTDEESLTSNESDGEPEMPDDPGSTMFKGPTDEELTGNQGDADDSNNGTAETSDEG